MIPKETFALAPHRTLRSIRSQMGSAAPPSPLFNDPIDSHEGSRAIPALPACSLLGTGIQNHWDNSGSPWTVTSFSLGLHSTQIHYSSVHPCSFFQLLTPQCHLFLTKTDSGPSKFLLDIWGSLKPEDKAGKKRKNKAWKRAAPFPNLC